MELCLKFVFAFGEEQLVGAVEIGLGDEDVGQAVEVAVIGRGGVHEFLRGGDAVLFEHHHERFRVDDGAGVEKFHRDILKAAE